MGYQRSVISARQPDLMTVNKKKKKKRTRRIVEFVVPADHRVKIKENEKKKKKKKKKEGDKYLELAKE